MNDRERRAAILDLAREMRKGIYPPVDIPRTDSTNACAVYAANPELCSSDGRLYPGNRMSSILWEGGPFAYPICPDCAKMLRTFGVLEPSNHAEVLRDLNTFKTTQRGGTRRGRPGGYGYS